MPAKLIAATSRSVDLQFLSRIAGRAKLELHHLRDEHDLKDVIKQFPNSVLFWDIDNMDFNVKSGHLSHYRMSPIVEKSLKPEQVFALANKSMFELPPVNQLQSIGHYLIRKYDDYAINWISKLVTTVSQKKELRLEDLKEKDSTIQKLVIKSTVQKNATLQAIGELLAKRIPSERFIEVMMKNIDELLLNAFFNAPLDGKHYYRKELDRETKLTFKAKEYVTLSVVFNPDEILIVVKDQFGSFVPTDAWKFVRENYKNKGYAPNHATKSAGLGLHGILNTGVALLIHSEKNLETQAILSFPYVKRFRQAKNCFICYSFP